MTLTAVWPYHSYGVMTDHPVGSQARFMKILSYTHTATHEGLRRRPASRRAPVREAKPQSKPTERLDLIGATALVVGSIVGVGIFNLPSSLAPYGPVTLVSMGLTTIGALALARLFASLASRMPADGGPYAYSRVAFGNKLGFANAWSYWITAWAGNAAIAVGWVLYVEVFINKGQAKLWSILLVLVGLWVPAFVNLSGLKNMGAWQVATTIMKFAALLFMSIVGLFYIKSANFHPWNVSGNSDISAIGSGMAIALFSYLGVETASVAAKNVRDPDRNIPRATLLGTFASAVVYMLSLTAVFGIVSNHALQNSTAPFSTAVNTMFGGTFWGNVMAAVVIISGIGALNGWTMVTAEMPRAAAQDGVFPERFERLNRRGVPAYGIVFSTVLASIVMIVNYLGSDGQTVFTTLVLMTGITAAIPYAFSALAQIKWRIADQKKLETPRFARDMIVAVLSVIFSILFIYYSRNTGHSFWVYWAPYLMTIGAFLVGIPVYRKQRNKMKDVGEVPPYRA
jgi:basic amino acid/polyamine antiporter, APA family